MSGMIPHHAQAVLIAGWAPTHGARADVRVLCERIVVAQRDEIALMQTWLRDRGQAVPAANATHMTMMMDGMEHEMLMPGMLTDDELAQLDKSRGSEFDRLFLRAMIGHHQGAVTMVDDALRCAGRWTGRSGLQVRVGRLRRSDHGDRANAKDACRDRRPAVAGSLILDFEFLQFSDTSTGHPIVKRESSLPRSGTRGPAAPLLFVSLAACVLYASACASSSSSHRPESIARDKHVDLDAQPRSARRPQARASRLGHGKRFSNAAAKPRGTCDSSRTRRRSEKFVGMTRIPTSRSSGTTPFRATTTASRCGTSRTSAQSVASRPRTSARRRRATSRSIKNLLFVSAEGLTGRQDCGGQGVPDSVSAMRVRGIRIFDISDIAKPKYITDVQTCRGSHTHTVLVDRTTRTTSTSTSRARGRSRSAASCPAARTCARTTNPNSQLFRIEVIKVPLAHPAQAQGRQLAAHLPGSRAPPPTSDARDAPATASSAPAKHRAGAARRDGAARRGGAPTVRGSGPTQCHDITVYPAIGLAGGACGGYGLLLDIAIRANPKRIGAVADSNFSFWHSATFSNDGSKILFTDEWGGGIAAALPDDRQARVGRRRALHARRTTR